MPHSSALARRILAGGSTPTTISANSRGAASAGEALALDQRARPQRAGRLLDDLGEQLLPADRAALVARRDALEEGGGEVVRRLSKVEPRVTIGVLVGDQIA